MPKRQGRKQQAYKILSIVLLLEDFNSLSQSTRSGLLIFEWACWLFLNTEGRHRVSQIELIDISWMAATVPIILYSLSIAFDLVKVGLLLKSKILNKLSQ